jgi:hypothetical protein
MPCELGGAGASRAHWGCCCSISGGEEGGGAEQGGERERGKRRRRRRRRQLASPPLPRPSARARAPVAPGPLWAPCRTRSSPRPPSSPSSLSPSKFSPPRLLKTNKKTPNPPNPPPPPQPTTRRVLVVRGQGRGRLDRPVGPVVPGRRPDGQRLRAHVRRLPHERLHDRHAPGGVALLSGSPLSSPVWRALAPRPPARGGGARGGGGGGGQAAAAACD